MAGAPLVALLRGINVSGHHKVPMAELRALLEESGCTGVRTYIQSGNVVLEPPERPDLQGWLAARIGERFGFPVPVVVRTAEQLQAVVAANPFDADPKLLHVGFLAERPAPQAVAALDPERSPPDRFAVRGGEVFVRYATGSARSKLTADWFDRGLRTTVTFRNWRTVCTLAEMVG